MKKFKKCRGCGENKDFSSFSKNKKRKDGLQTQCAACNKKRYLANRERNLAWAKKYQQKNKESIAATKKAYREANKEKLRSINKKWRDKNKEHIAQKNKIYYKNNKESIAARKKAYYDANKDKLSAQKKKYYWNNKEVMAERNREQYESNKEARAIYSKKYYEANKEKIKARHLKYHTRRYKKDPTYRLGRSVRRLIVAALCGKNFTKTSLTSQILGCSFEELKLHIELQFTEGMTWDNHGRYGWHLDHILPLSAGATEEEIYALSHYTNLQPMWGSENISKHDKHCPKELAAYLSERAQQQDLTPTT